MSCYRRALRHVPLDRTGQIRWIIVSKETGKPVGLRTSFPSEQLARANCGPGQEPRQAQVAANAGPFGDQLVYN